MSALIHKPKCEKLLCSCCPMPFAYVQQGRLVIVSRHNHKAHTNALTAQQLRKIADEMEKDR